MDASTSRATGDNSKQPPRQRRAKQKKDPLAALNMKSKKNVQHMEKLKVPPTTSRPLPSRPLSQPAGPASFAERPRSPTPPGDAHCLPIYTTKRALLEGLRYHVARMNSKEIADVTDETKFVRPIRLHRRDPRIQPGADGLDIDSKDDMLDEKAREIAEIQKAERQRIREENAKMIAPSAASKKPPAFKKKVEQVYRTDDNPDDRKRSQLRYEEALPWHLEDFDNKNIWQGSYEAALSDCHVAVMQYPQDTQREAHLKLLPMEKWYRFREKTKVKHKAVDDVDELMHKKVKDPAFLIKHEQQEKAKKMYAMEANKARGLFQRAGSREEAKAKESGSLFGDGDVTADADDIDFDLNEEFADDDENPIFEGDDDTQKLAEERVKRDQLAANVFGMTDEKQVDEEAEKEKKAAELRKQLEKGTRKALIKREKKYDYDSDSDGNPYTSSSEEEDSDAERAKEVEEKKKAETDKEKQNGKGKEGEKPGSGASTTGANTPSGRHEKHGESRKSQGPSLKRPGSPNLSDASGNESSRNKKAKTQHGSRLVVGMSPKATPNGSRAGSPAAPVSRATSPPVASAGGLPTKEEVLANIPEEGIVMKDLIGKFPKVKTMPTEMKQAFMKLVKDTVKFDKKTNLLSRRE